MDYKDNTPIPSVIEYLERRGCPVASMEDKLTPSLEEKLATAMKSLSSDVIGIRVAIVHGLDSPQKYVFITNMLKELAINNRSVMYLSANDIKDNPDYQSAVYAIVGMEAVTGYQIVKVKDFVRKKVSNNKIVIIACNSIENLDKSYGSDFVDFLSHKAMSIDVSIKRKKLTEI